MAKLNREKIFILKFIQGVAYPEQKPEAKEQIKDLHWSWIVKICMWQRLGGFLYCYLEKHDLLDVLNPKLQQQLKAGKERAHQNALDKLKRFKKISELFERVDIPLIPIKGVALLGHVYQDQLYRNMKDIDILVEEKRKEAAYQLLKQEGFRLEKIRFRNRWHREIHGSIADPFQYCPLKRLNLQYKEIYLDLHWGGYFEIERCETHLEDSALWSSAKPHESFQGKTVRQLSFEHEFIWVFLHCVDFNSPSLTQLLDLTVLKTKIGPNIDIELFALLKSAPESLKQRLSHCLKLIPNSEPLPHEYTSLSHEAVQFFDTFFDQRATKRIIEEPMVRIANPLFKMTFFEKILFILGYFFPDPDYYKGKSLIGRYFTHWGNHFKKLFYKNTD